MLILNGSQALSQATKSKLLSKLQNAGLAVENFSTRFVHVADVSADLDQAEMLKLESLLSYGPKADDKEVSGEKLIVSPRAGTISPWSSKASNIAHNCGLSKIKRIERKRHRNRTRKIIKQIYNERSTNTKRTSPTESLPTRTTTPTSSVS